MAVYNEGDLIDVTDPELFELDRRLAERMEAVENGTLTPEQKKNRELMLNWLGVKPDKR